MSTKELDINGLEHSFIEYCNGQGYDVQLDYGIQVEIHNKKTLSKLNFKVHFFKLECSNNIDILVIHKGNKYNIVSCTNSTFEICDYKFIKLFDMDFGSESDFNENIIRIVKKIDNEQN